MQRHPIHTRVFVSLFFAACIAMFAVSARAQTEKILHAFTGGNDGSEPDAGLTLAPSGNLYGSAFSGGSTQQGVIFELIPVAGRWQQTVLYTFQGGATDGANPTGTLTLAADTIFGTTVSGGAGNGVVFQLTPSGGNWKETILHVFGTGETPINSGVIMDKAGNLYGETAGGGALGNGTIYELEHATTGWKYRLLYSFAGGTDGSFPSGGLIFDGQGNLYGTTANGGTANNVGTVFELVKGAGGTWSEKVLYAFQGGADGVNPEAPVILDKSGNLYGTTVYGGDTACAQGYGCGEVFELMPAGNGIWTKSTLHAFTDTPDGHAPSAGLTFDKAGHLFGTTSNGGSAGTGCLFELVSQMGGWHESVVYSFTNGNDGGYPSTPVTIDSKGHLFGTASFGGQYTFGVAFEFSGVAASE